MTMMHRVGTAPTLACLVALMASVAVAEPPGFGRPPGPDLAAMLERDAAEIGLQEETLDQIRAIVAEGRNAGAELRDKLHRERQALHRLLAADRPDETEVLRQAERIGALETEGLKQRLRTLLAVHPLLTDEQLRRLRELREGRLQSVREACRAEFERYCGDVPAGPGRFRCLRSHRDRLSPECAKAMVEMRTRMGRP